MKMRHICMINTASQRSKEHIHSLVQIKNKIKKRESKIKQQEKIFFLVCFCREPLSDATILQKSISNNIFLLFTKKESNILKI